VHQVLGSSDSGESDIVRLTEEVVQWVETIGVAVLLIGGIVVLVGWLARPGRWTPDAYRRVRRSLAKVILLVLEILVAADLIQTVIVEPTLETMAALGLLVVVRTLLAWSIVVELEGTWPWKVRALGGTPLSGEGP
jgi:uncharacterized membrane protein